jgi:hypothetical protein
MSTWRLLVAAHSGIRVLIDFRIKRLQAVVHPRSATWAPEASAKDRSPSRRLDPAMPTDPAAPPDVGGLSSGAEPRGAAAQR